MWIERYVAVNMSKQLTTTRQERGQQIAKLDNQIKRINENTYEVLSQSGNGTYEVLNTSIGWMCQCPDHIYKIGRAHV